MNQARISVVNVKAKFAKADKDASGFLTDVELLAVLAGGDADGNI